MQTLHAQAGIVLLLGEHSRLRGHDEASSPTIRGGVVGASIPHGIQGGFVGNHPWRHSYGNKVIS